MSTVLSPSTYNSNSSHSISLNSPYARTTHRIPSPTSPSIGHNGLNGTSPKGSGAGAGSNGVVPVGGGLLIPTDRSLEELEEKWLPLLGRLKVDREVLLHGYALYNLRNWYLSRTHWAQTIVTQTGKPSDHVSAYLLVPDPLLSEAAGKAEIAAAVQKLLTDTHAQQRKTEHGILLVTSPSTFGQDVFPIPGGDLREMRPFLVVNTGLRRLGCGGRAAMGMESPIPAVRRKFLELYRLPSPPNHSTSRPTSPSASPTKVESPSAWGPNPTSSPNAILADPFSHMVLELVKLIQSALSLWGMISSNVDIDGLLCDETKAGVYAWRRSMGMEHEESMRIEKETSGGVIDPKTLAALLSSITSTRYQLDALGVEKVPKDPLSSPRRFLHAWHAYQASIGLKADRAEFLTVSSIRHLNSLYLNDRTKSPDALKVHRFLFSGVASATSSIHANLKGGGLDDTPLRKREHHHLRNRLEDGSSESGFGLIVPAGEVGVYAPPDVLTSDLEAYTKGILKSREKDWDVMGARRIGALWSGQTELRYRRSHRGLNGRVLRRRNESVDEVVEDGNNGPRGTLEKIKDGLGLVSRRGTYETSDSDTGGPGPASLRNVLARRKQNTVPTVIEPDVEEVDEQLDPQPAGSHNSAVSRLDVERPYGTNTSRHSFLSGTSHGRPSIITSLSNDGSDTPSRRSYVHTSPKHERNEEFFRDRRPSGMAERAVAWRSRGRATTMLRTASDGADVALEEGGMEWEVVNPHGTGKGRAMSDRPLVRRHSLQDRFDYRTMRLSAANHLAIDVEMCGILLDLRKKERLLAEKALEAKTFEESIFKATQDIIDAIRSRRTQLSSLQAEVDKVEKDIRRAVDEVDENDSIQWASKKIQFFLSEDTHFSEILWNLRRLEHEWEEVRAKVEEEKKCVQVTEGRKWWWFW